MKQKPNNAMRRASDARLVRVTKCHGTAQAPRRFAGLGVDIPARKVAATGINRNASIV